MRKYILTAAMCLLVASCGSGSSEATSSSSEGEGTVASESQNLKVAKTFGPEAGLAIETDDAYVLADSGSIESLTLSTVDGEPTPALATSWNQVDDTSWEFTLRPDTVFHDGTPLTAESVVQAFDFLSSAATPPKSLGGIKLTTEALDEQTVRITTDSPDPILPLRLSSPNTAILSAEAYESTPADPIGHGTGAFEIVEYEENQSIAVERFDDYWGETAKLETAELLFLPDASARAAAIRSGEVQIADGISISDVEAIEKDEALTLRQFALPRTASVYTNTKAEPMTDIAVREATQLAIDEELIAAELLEGQFVPARGYFGPESEWAPTADEQPTDGKDLAIAKLEESGYKTDGTDPALNVSLWTYPDRPELEAIATVVQSQLQEVGFAVELEVADYTALEPKVLEGNHDLFVLSRSYYLDVADAGAFLTSDFTCDGGYNLNHYCSEEFDGIIDGLSEAISQEDREEIFAQANQILLDDIVGFPIVHDQARIALSENVNGFVDDPFERIMLTPELSLG